MREGETLSDSSNTLFLTKWPPNIRNGKSALLLSAIQLTLKYQNVDVKNIIKGYFSGEKVQDL